MISIILLLASVFHYQEWRATGDRTKTKNKLANFAKWDENDS